VKSQNRANIEPFYANIPPCGKTSEILLDNSGNDAHGNAPIFVDVRHSKADIILFSRHPTIITGMGNRVNTIGETDVDDAFMHVGDLAGILALDAAFFEIVVAVVLSDTLFTSALMEISSRPLRLTLRMRTRI
jgi:hypothetical protein